MTYCQWWGSAPRWRVSVPGRDSWTWRSPRKCPRRPGPGPSTAPRVCRSLTTWGTPSGPRRRPPCLRSSESASPAAAPRRSPSTAGSPGWPPAGPLDPASGPASARHTCCSAQTLWPKVCLGALGTSERTQVKCFYYLWRLATTVNEFDYWAGLVAGHECLS